MYNGLHGAYEMICIYAGVDVSLGNHELQNGAREITKCNKKKKGNCVLVNLLHFGRADVRELGLEFFPMDALF